MGQFDLNSARILLSVTQTGSFRKTADILGVPKSNVSRKISELEADLGAKLLNRTTRSVSLTDAGRVFTKHAEDALLQFDGAERAVLELQSNPQGQLRITTTVAMGQQFLSRLVVEFLSKYPEIKINLHLTDREVDLVSERYDVAIRIGKLEDSSLVAKLIGKSSYRVVASPAYLKKYGIPESPEDLRNQSCLRLRLSSGATWSDWPFKTGKTGRAARSTQEIPVKGRFIADDFLALREAAIAGIGIARLPSHLVRDQIESRKLVSVLDQYAPAATPIHLIHLGGNLLPPSTRAFIDFVHPRLSEAFR